MIKLVGASQAHLESLKAIIGRAVRLGYGLSLLASLLGLLGCMTVLQRNPPHPLLTPVSSVGSLSPTTVLSSTEAVHWPIRARPTLPALASATPLPSPTITAPPLETALPQLPSARPTLAPSPSPPLGQLIVLPTPLPQTNQERWRAQEREREVFSTLRTYTTPSSQLWWYDPVNQQHVILGTLSGEFEAQARFELYGQGVAALEVPYQINRSYGLTALSPALVERMQAAGYSEWLETYVFVTPEMLETH